MRPVTGGVRKEVEVSLPSGTLTLLFTDIESSMRLWSADADAMSASLEAHDRLMIEQIEAGGGYVFARTGDSLGVAFDSARDAIAVAQLCQRRLARTPWPGPELKVRMGLHTGEVQVRDDDYVGPAVNLAGRVVDAGHGGQIVATAHVLAVAGPAEVTAELGLYLLRGSDEPTTLHQIGPGDFPPLRAERSSAAMLRFDEFELDPAMRSLRIAGEHIQMEPQVLDVLLYLVTNRDRLISREELLDEVWGDQFVSNSALTTRIKQARQALGDDGRTQRYIRNERGRGYQFVGTIEFADSPVAAERATPSGLAAAPGPEPAPSVAPYGAMFGRADDVRALQDLVKTSPLTTVLGPGGVGKTTLVSALRADWEAEGQQPAFVALDRVRDDAALAPALMTAIGLSGVDDEHYVQACADWIGGTGDVLILDNCEHLLDGVRGFVAELLELVPSARVLTTSRQRLGLDGEAVHRLAPFDVPAEATAASVGDWPCLELFAATAARSGRMRPLADDDWTEVIELCRRLDGLPLAIELAASRLSTLGLHDLSEGFDVHLDWFRNRDVDAGDRQHSLRSTVEWSFRFLDDESQAVVAAMALCPGGLTLPQVAALTERLGIKTFADEITSRLVEASVLSAEFQRGSARYTMLETIRQFGLELLNADEELRVAAEGFLCGHARSVAGEERAYWIGERDPRRRSLAKLRDEVPNLRAGRDLMLAQGNHAGVVELAVGLCAFTEEACLAELWSWHDVGGLDLGTDAEAKAGAILLEATAARNKGDIAGSGRAAAEAAELSDDVWIKGRALHTGAMAALFSGDPGRAIELWLASDEQLGGCRGRLFSAMASAFAGDLDRAGVLLSECEIEPDSAVPVDLFANLHLVKGEVARVAGTGTAREEFEAAVDVAHQHDLAYSFGIAQVPLVTILEAEGDTVGAAEGYRELIELFLRSGTWTQIWTTLRNAVGLIGTISPATALLIRAAADRAPTAPVLDEGAAADMAALGERLAEQLTADELDQLERRVPLASRTDVVREAVAVLARLS